MINKIYLHWTAGQYNQIFNSYHYCITGNGEVHKMGEPEEIKSHTWLRNTDAIGIALCCGYGAGIMLKEDGSYSVSWGFCPPTFTQVTVMGILIADLCEKYKIPITKDNILTHAEVALLDGYSIYDNDPDMRWDLITLPWINGESGGEYIRKLAMSN